MIRPLQRYATSGELNFHNEHQDETIAQLQDEYSRAAKAGGPPCTIDTQDGLRIDFADWWFNVRKSNTEPLLRLNAEANTADLLAARMAELTPKLGTPEAH
jgi:phosphomannomutase